MSRAIDISNYSGYLDDRQVEWLKANCQLVIVRLSTEDKRSQRDIAAQQVLALHAAGVPWQGYLWCYWDMDPYEHWRLATEKLTGEWPSYHRLAIWLDMEDVCRPAWHALEWVSAYAGLLAADGFLPGVYTGQWWLDQHREAFEGGRAKYWTQYPLWWAHYGIEPTCTPPNLVPWEQAAMHQYRSVGHGSPLSAYDVSLVCAEI